MSEMTLETRPLSKRMLLDGMYPGIVEKWATEVGELEARIEVLEIEVTMLRSLQHPTASSWDCSHAALAAKPGG